MSYMAPTIHWMTKAVDSKEQSIPITFDPSFTPMQKQQWVKAILGSISSTFFVKLLRLAILKV